MATIIKEKKFELFVGIDVHLKSWHVTICSKSMKLKSFSQPPDAGVLKQYLDRHYPNSKVYSVYEAGYCGFSWHYKLTDLGIHNIVVNPGDVPTTDKGKRTKTDQVDSYKLAKSLRGGLLNGIHIPSIEFQKHRGIMRTRSQLVKDVSRMKNRIKSSLRFYGIKIPEDYLRSNGYWKKEFINWLNEVSLEFESIGLQLKIFSELNGQLKTLNKQILEMSALPAFKRSIDLLTSIPGIGKLTGMIILSEVGNMRRFKKFDNLCSFVGLIPNVYASGEKQYVGQLTKRGNNYLKKILIECSWSATRQDPALTRCYEKLKLRMNGNKAIIRIARKLLSRIRHVLLNEEAYIYGVN